MCVFQAVQIQLHSNTAIIIGDSSEDTGMSVVADENDVQDPLKPLAEVLQPDPRQSFIVGTLSDLHKELSALVLRDGVPAAVRQLFETAKNVRLYAFFAFRFHQVAEMVGYQALEMALRERWIREEAMLVTPERPARPVPMLHKLLQSAVKREWLKSDGFSTARLRAFNALQGERAIEAIRLATANEEVESDKIKVPTIEEIDARAKIINVPALLVQFLPDFRNALAHGSRKLVPNGMMLYQDICDAINMLFA